MPKKQTDEERPFPNAHQTHEAYLAHLLKMEINLKHFVPLRSILSVNFVQQAGESKTPFQATSSHCFTS